MAKISLLRDAPFLKELDLSNLKTFYVKILVLDKDELPLRAIEGRASGGSITQDGASSIHRAGNLTMLAEETVNDLSDVDNLIAMNKKIKILVGIENNIDKNYDKIIWINQGIFVITQPSISHTLTGVNISINFKDKMCLMNGECGGGLPTSVTFHEYDQMIGFDNFDNAAIGYTTFPAEPNDYTVYLINGKYYIWDVTNGWEENESNKNLIGTIISRPQSMYDIIQTAVHNYGGEALDKIIINDLEREIKSIVRYIGSDTVYYNIATDMYTLDEEVAAANPGVWRTFNYNENCGFQYTTFVYPGELISSIGDNVCSILDRIIEALGNYEYFYDREGNFVFQEIKNYLNTQYDAVQKLDENGFLLNSENYYVDFSNMSKSAYTFNEGSALISSYTNTPNYSNIKNDFHIWGKNEDGFAIHYHIAIKEKPLIFNKYYVVDELDKNGEYTGRVKWPSQGEKGYLYIPTDWRAELYLRGLEKKSLQQRPDIYEQELLDLFDIIYDMREKKFKADIVNRPNDLKYWFDYIEPLGRLQDISVDTIGSKVYSYQQDKIIRLYDSDIPNVIMINADGAILARASIMKKCESLGQKYSNVSKNIEKDLAIGDSGYSAMEVARQLLYQYTDYNAAISITSIPIYYLDVNTRITVYDRFSGIYGDYIINSINVPLDARNTMTISATRALERV